MKIRFFSLTPCDCRLLENPAEVGKVSVGGTKKLFKNEQVKGSTDF